MLSHDPNVDPVGACVGARGSRVRQVVNELRGEKVDIVEWRDDTRAFISEALSPARVKEVRLDEDDKVATVIVPDHQLSLAIGKEGQNARLAARLTGYKIDIRSESQDLGLEIDEETGLPVAAEEEAPEAGSVPATGDAEEAIPAASEVAAEADVPVEAEASADEVAAEETSADEALVEETPVEETPDVPAEQEVVEDEVDALADEVAEEPSPVDETPETEDPAV